MMAVLDFQVITPRGNVEQIMRVANGVVTIIPPARGEVAGAGQKRDSPAVPPRA